MKVKGKMFAFFAMAFFGLTGCGNNELDQDVQPLADAMCEYIEIRNNLQEALVSGDSLNIVKFEAEKHKMTTELSILNQEFNAKYGDLVKDQEFGKKFKKAMNKAMIDCPSLSEEDRAMMQNELNE